VSLARALGSNAERFVVLHADDVGMCEATVSAYRELLGSDVPIPASTMVPCGWFPAAAALCRAHPEADMGVHLTLTSEWDAYRWGPISTRDPASGLLDAEGCFPRTVAPVVRGAKCSAVRTELEAQLDRALAAGIDVTHLDCHMAVLFNDTLAPDYVELARKRRLPIFNARWDRRLLESIGVDSATLEPDPDFPAFDRAWMSPLDRPDEDPFERVRRKIGALPIGLTQLIFHPATDGVELRAIAPDHRARVADLAVLRSDKLAGWLREEGIEAVSYKRLREVVHASA
jgi:chitin disaccharide deacetylase